MKRRIRMIAGYRRPGRWAWLSGIALAVLGLVCLTDAQTPDVPASDSRAVEPKPATPNPNEGTSNAVHQADNREQLTAQLVIEVKVFELPFEEGTRPHPRRILGLPDLVEGPAKSVADEYVPDLQSPLVLTATQCSNALQRLGSLSRIRTTPLPKVITVSGRSVRLKAPATNRPSATAAASRRDPWPVQNNYVDLDEGIRVDASVLPDRLTIDTFTITGINRFLGYDFSAGDRQFDWVPPRKTDSASEQEVLPPATPVRPDDEAGIAAATLTHSPLRSPPKPVFRTHFYGARARVWDGQTMVVPVRFSGPNEWSLGRTPDLRPPMIELQRDQESRSNYVLALVFITPTLVDPAGNRVHRDADLPFARNDTPRQVPVKPVPSYFQSGEGRELHKASPASGGQEPTQPQSGRQPASTNRVGSLPRHRVFETLERIRLPRVGFDRVPLPQVVKELARLARENDPEQRGVNFLLSAPIYSEKTPPINAQTGMPESVAEPSVENVVVSLAVLKDVTLGQALDAVVKCASQPIKFHVEERAVVISAATTEVPALYTRWFKVDPNTFARALGELIGDGLTNSPPTVARTPSLRSTNAPAMTLERLRRFLSSTGIDLVPPKNIVYNDRLGMFMVRATLRDLEIVEQAIQVLNQSPPQVSIEVKFAEVSADDADAKEFLSLIGFDAAATNAVTTTPNTYPPGSFMSGVENPSASDRSGRGGILTAGTNLWPPAFTSILKPDQFRAVVQALEKRKGVDLLSMPKVTTLSGRQAQIKTVEIKYVVTDIDNSPALDRKPQPIAEPFELGPILDVIPDVSADGRTIRMTMIPTIKEFLGYDLETGKQFQKATGATAAVPLPTFRLRQVMATANVADGQTVVLSPGAIEVEAKSGGRQGKTTRKHLFIFVTPTLIDPAGNPVHGRNSRP